jgi:leader peptidase (prepilin peptidase)/N-methyltransferase
MILLVWIVPLLFWLFLLGAAVGSFLNVCIYRISQGKSLIWPGSRCGHCLHEVRLKDNIPLVSYWVLGGRCRDCGAVFSIRYFGLELMTALTFVAVYLLEIGLNVQHLAIWEPDGFEQLSWGHPPLHWWPLFIFHIVLACFLIVAVACLLDHGRIPASIIATGTLAGLVGAVLFPWPYPEPMAAALITPSALVPLYPHADGGTRGHPWRGAMPRDQSWANASLSPRPGFYAWPVWGPLPAALPPGSWQLGLGTGLAGALVGAGSLRLIGLLWRRAANVASLGMIAGAFLGWQPVLVAVVVGLIVALLLGRWRDRLPWLGVGIVVVWFGWAWIGPALRPVFFNPLLGLPLLAALALGIVIGPIGPIGPMGPIKSSPTTAR